MYQLWIWDANWQLRFQLTDLTEEEMNDTKKLASDEGFHCIEYPSS